MGVKCFLLEPLDRQRRSLRRYSSGQGCVAPWSYHSAMVPLDEVDIIYGESEGATRRRVIKNADGDPKAFDGDPRWPKKCERCDYVFAETDPYQIFTDQLWRRSDNGEVVILRDAAPGAMWNAWWMGDIPQYQGPDGKCLIVRLPDRHDWMIDSRASNCDSPCKVCNVPYQAHKEITSHKGAHDYEDGRPHKCWVRHGQPPNLTVDKAGVTCGAGGGSILTPNWHGFLRSGELVT